MRSNLGPHLQIRSRRIGDPGLGSGCGLAVDHENGMGNTPGHAGLRIGARMRLAAVGGGRARRSIAGARDSGGSGAGAQARKGPGACTRAGRTSAGVYLGSGGAPQGLATAAHGGAAARTLVAGVLASRARHG